MCIKTRYQRTEHMCFFIEKEGTCNLLLLILLQQQQKLLLLLLLCILYQVVCPELPSSVQSLTETC